MANFMPIDVTKANELNDRLSRTMFKSPGDFVEFYNSGLVNKKHPDVVALMNEIISTFRDVKEKNNKLIFISQAEVYLDEIRDELAQWGSLVPLKGRLRELLAEETLDQNEIIVFSSKEIGYVVRQDPETGEVVRVSDKLFNRQVEIKPLYERYSTQPSPELEKEGTYRFRVSDLTDVDDSFIADIREILPL